MSSYYSKASSQDKLNYKNFSLNINICNGMLSHKLLGGSVGDGNLKVDVMLQGTRL